jgi:ABC-type transport system involved in cytochrome c biogenesis permease subunit
MMFKRIQRSFIFKYLSSAKLAVPLMLVIGAVVAAGTLFESRYNAQVAGIMVYHTWWFQSLMFLLWVNIFLSTLSRYPYKKHHIGFVIVHIGLLTLLVGGEMTALLGVDGQLRVVEGAQSNTVMLSDLILKVSHQGSAGVQTYPIERKLEPQTGAQLGLSQLRGDAGLTVAHYIPFATVDQALARSGDPRDASVMAISFTMQSRFFNVSDSLQSRDKAEAQIGPAHLRLVIGQGKEKTSRRVASAGADSGAFLLVKDEKSGRVLKTVSIGELKKGLVTVQGVEIQLTHTYEQAVVDAKKLTEKGGRGLNPALEFELKQGSQTLREVAFSKFAAFSLNAKGSFGLRFEYRAGISESGPGQQDIPMHGNTEETQGGGMPAMGSTANTIEFHAAVNDTKNITVRLLKNGSEVFSKNVAIGEVLETPWMGMKITVNSIVPGGVMTEAVRPTEMQVKSPLPPSALLIQSDLPGTEGVWIIQGDARTIQTSRGLAEVYYGENAVSIPFNVQLEQFRKIDYPGTETALSFESTIRLSDGGSPLIVKMNEPLQHGGYLLYQSSYEQGPGTPTASIFSVNHDPGRWVKYIGAIILIMGIAIFTVMRSKWFYNLSQSRVQVSRAACATATLVLLLGAIAMPGVARANEGPSEGREEGGKSFSAFTPEAAQTSFSQFASKIESAEIEELPVQSHGRIKPFDSLAREAVLFVTGKYSMWNLDSVQLFLGLMLSESTPYLEIINVRDPDLRVALGFKKTQRYLSLQEIANSPLEQMVAPIAAKERKNEKSVTPDEKKILEVDQQVSLVKALLNQSYFGQSIVLDVESAPGQGPGTAHGQSSEVLMQKASQYLHSLQEGRSEGSLAAMELISVANSQPMPELFRANLSKLRFEARYNHLRPFFWIGVLYFLLGVVLMSGLLKKQLTPKIILGAIAVPAVLHAFSFLARVYITGFAPVTNMYGTMVWVAFGVIAFGTILFALYRNIAIMSLLLIGAGLTLLLTESIPLILSPDMDPIVAVLRNNFWLTIHVLTISISYAAFTIAMLIGNAALVQAVFKKSVPENLKTLSHLAYRAIQLGVFLLTTGIILGGWWADYSWGRFWGWDPKETWALIADLGFLAILHARYVGWLDSFGILSMAPLAYLLVIMAWYGVNFILAAGLHSYGFSSGGATIVVVFVTIQLLLFIAGSLSKKFRGLAV